MLQCVAVVVIVATIGTIAIGPKSYSSANLLLENVEALSNARSIKVEETCYSSITSKDGCMVRYCQTCEMTPGTDCWYALSHKCTPK